jgi:NADP-dependent aldehyde dehydrogenase
MPVPQTIEKVFIMELTGQNFIGAKRSKGFEKTFRAINPATGQPIGPEVHGASETEIDQAVKLAEAAFGLYRKIEPARRAQFLRAIATNIEQLGDELISVAVSESGLPPARLQGERGRTTGQLRIFADLIEEGSWVNARIDHADANRKPAPKPDVRLMKIALGPVAVFAASNFPLAFSVAGGDTASALAAGCTVIVKAHPSHPGTSELVACAIIAAAETCKMPDGVFSLVQGTEPRVSIELIRHPLLAAVGFTGSLKAGRAIFDAASARPQPIPVYAEMGSVNPVFLLPGAISERGPQIAEGLKGSVTLGVGQFCTNPGIIFAVESDATRSFLEQLGKLISASPIGTMLNPNIGRAFAEGCRKFSHTPGVTVSGKSPDSPQQPTHAAPILFTTSAQNFLANPALHEELFGPATLVVIATSVGQLLELAQYLEGQLTATIHAGTGELVKYRAFVDTLERKAGRLIFNSYPTGVEVCHAMQHGGPYPATTDSRSTSVGTAAIDRFVRPVAFQDFPSDLLPPELMEDNPRKIMRLVDGQRTR